MGTQQVRDVMRSPVIVATPDYGYKQLVDVLADFEVSAVPVVDADNRVIGMVSEADLLHKLEFDGQAVHARLLDRPGRRGAKEKATGDTASDLMTSPAITVTADATIGAAARIMEHRHVKRLPVVDEHGLLIGIVSRRDLLRHYLRSDEAITRDVREGVLLHTMWLDPTDIQVHVTDGVVTLSGEADRRSTARIVAQLVRAVDGVVNVIDRMTWSYDDTATGRRYVFDAELR